MGQNRKYSLRADDVRSTPESGLNSDIRPCPKTCQTRTSACAYSAECCPPTGIASSKIEPSESDLTSRNLPPWFSTTVKQIASPSPIPPDFVVKNGSNIRSRSSTRIPGPESWTESITVE